MSKPMKIDLASFLIELNRAGLCKLVKKEVEKILRRCDESKLKKEK